MFKSDEDKKKIEMTEGDFGIVLPISISGIELNGSDKFSLKIFEEIDGEPIITKTFENIVDNTLELQFTQEESQKLEVGSYYYDLDWFQDDTFLSNILRARTFKVNDKAGKVGG